MESFKVVLVEDDRFTRKVVEVIIRNHFPEFNVVAQTGLISEALAHITEFNPELVILDIQLEDGTAFDLLNILKPFNFKLVFMSAFQSYIEDAVQFAAVDFIKKPFDESEFVMALDKVIEAFSDIEYAQKIDVLFANMSHSPAEKSILLRNETVSKQVLVSDIVYGSSFSGGSVFHLINGDTIKVPQPLRRFELLLTGYGFFRCHPLYVVNLRMIKEIDTKNSELIFVSNNKAPFEDWRKENLINKYNQLTSS